MSPAHAKHAQTHSDDERVILWEMALDAPLTASTMG